MSESISQENVGFHRLCPKCAAAVPGTHLRCPKLFCRAEIVVPPPDPLPMDPQLAKEVARLGDEANREAAINTLVRMGPSVCRALAYALRTGDVLTREGAAQVLCRLSCSEASAMLKRTATNDWSDAVRVVAVHGINDEDTLLDVYKVGSDAVRSAVLECLGEIKWQDIVPETPVRMEAEEIGNRIVGRSKWLPFFPPGQQYPVQMRAAGKLLIEGAAIARQAPQDRLCTLAMSHLARRL